MYQLSNSFKTVQSRTIFFLFRTRSKIGNLELTFLARFFVLFIPRSLKRRHRRRYERLVLAGQNDAKVSTPEVLAHGISPHNCATADIPVGNDVSFVFPPVVALLVYCVRRIGRQRKLYPPTPFEYLVGGHLPSSFSHRHYGRAC